jgi:hypothetical protein
VHSLRTNGCPPPAERRVAATRGELKTFIHFLSPFIKALSTLVSL